jgi:hypothetical protein
MSRGRKSGKKRKKKSQELPRVTVGAALRVLGVDEWQLAQGYRTLVASDPGRSKSGATQSYLRVLNECSRQLAETDGPEIELSDEAFERVVKLSHDVERPVREEEEEESDIVH